MLVPFKEIRVGAYFRAGDGIYYKRDRSKAVRHTGSDRAFDFPPDKLVETSLK
jgi:hypothetical protein